MAHIAIRELASGAAWDMLQGSLVDLSINLD